MKKLIAVIVALFLMLSAVAAFAAPALHTVNWSKYQDKAAQTDGRFTNVTGTNLKMFVPSEFKASQLSEETRKDGTSMVLKSEKDDKVVVNAQTLNIGIDAFKNNMEKKGINPSDNMILNNRPVTQYSINSTEATHICFASPTDNGNVQLISFSAADLKAHKDQFTLMAASVQNADAPAAAQNEAAAEN